MFCPQCGREVKENMKFCPGCGAAAASPAPAEVPAADPVYAAYAPPAAAPETYAPPAAAPAQASPYAPPAAPPQAVQQPVMPPQPATPQPAAPQVPAAPAAYTPPAPAFAVQPEPVQGYAPEQPEPAPAAKPVKKKKKLPVIISSCAAVVILAAAVAVFFWLNSNPAKTAQTALQKTMLSLKEETKQPLLPAFLTSEEEQHYTMTLTGDLAPLLGLDSNNQAQFSVKTVSDPDAGAMYMMLSALVNMEDMGVNLELDAELSMAGKMLAASVPKLLDQNVAVNLGSFISDWNASPMGQNAPIEGETARQLQAVLDSIIAGTDSKQELPNTTEYQEQLLKAWNDFKTEFTYEEIKDQEVPGGTGKATMIQITVSDTALHAWLEESISIVEDYYKDVLDVLPIDVLTAADYNLAQMQDSVDFSEFQKVLEDIEFEDVFINIYLDKSKAAQCVELSGTMRYDGNKVSVQAHAGTSDTAAPMTNWYAAVTVKAGSEKNTLKAKGSSTYSESKGYSHKLTLTPSGSDEAVTIKLDWNPSGKSDNLTASLQVGEQFYEFAGTYLFDEDSLTLGVSQIVYDQYAYNWDTGSGGYDRITQNLKLELIIEAQDSYTGKDLSKDALGVGDITEELIQSVAQKLAEIGIGGGYEEPVPTEPIEPTYEPVAPVGDPVSVVEDRTGTLTALDVEYLQSYGKEFCNYHGMSIMVYITDDYVPYNTNGEQDHDSEAKSVFRSYVNADYDGNQNGIMLYINMYSSIATIVTLDEAQNCYSQSVINDMINAVIDKLNNDGFYEGCNTFIWDSIDQYKQSDSSIAGQVVVFNESEWMAPETYIIDNYADMLSDYLLDAGYSAAAILLESSIGSEDPYVIAENYYRELMTSEHGCPPGLVFYMNLEDNVWFVISIDDYNYVFEDFANNYLGYAEWFTDNITEESPQIICYTYFDCLYEMFYTGHIG